MFVDVANLPKNVSDGPETWGEAMQGLIYADKDAQAVVESTIGDREALQRAYDNKIRQVEELTGQTLPNPMRVATGVDREMVGLQAGAAQLRSLAAADMMPGGREKQEEEFNAKVRVLADRYPQLGVVLETSIDEERDRVLREVERKAAERANSPELGPVDRFAAHLAGGLWGAAQDPVQWGMAVFGAGGAGAKTVAGRLGQTMLQEFALNAGQEAFLQAASQERKRAAGLDHGLADAMKNVGIAGTFGALFGGSVQAGAEIARVLNLGEGGAERAARVLDGRPEPGDLEAVAAATGRTIEPDEAATIARSFEERTLDEMMIPNDPTPEDVTLMSAAVRHADDPDNFPAPDIVERALADSADGPSRTLSADDYQRIYDGDPVAVDAYRDQVAAREAGGAVDIADTFDPDPVANMRIRPDEVSEPFDDASMARAERMAGDIPSARVLDPVREELALNPASSPSGDAPSPRPERAVDLLPFEDGNGNRTPINVAEALAIADEPTFHADLLEACRL